MRAASGIDVLLDDPLRWLAGARVGLATNQAAVTRDGRPTLEALRAHPSLRLETLFTFEHGLSGFEEDARPVTDRHDARTGLPLHSLYGPRRRPTPDALRDLDAVVVDVQDVGVRPYTYAATVALLLEAAAEFGTPVVICDRPNPLGGRVAGPPRDRAQRSFLAYLDVPFRHGLTLGELARRHAATALAGRIVPTVVPVPSWRRDAPAADGSFVPPSPGLPTRDALALYPGLVLLEGTNLSEGRGTSLPFALVGAPWLEGYALAREVNGWRLPGLWARPLDFEPESGPYAGRLCHGVQLHVEDAAALRPLTSGIRILAHLRERYADFAWTDAGAMAWSAAPDAGEPWHEPTRGPLIDGLTGGSEVRAVIEGRRTLAEAEASWRAAATTFVDSVAPQSLYGPPPAVASPVAGTA